MTRPTILDRDDVAVVPVEPTPRMETAFNRDFYAWLDERIEDQWYLWRAMLSASPHSSAWLEVREYVEGLEKKEARASASLTGLLGALEHHTGERHGIMAIRHLVDRIADLERHIEELQAKIDPDTDCACSYDEAGTVCNAHSPRVRELELRLAEAERVIEPFAAVAENDIGEDEYDDDVFRPMSAKNARAQLINVGHLRAARAWKEGK